MRKPGKVLFITIDQLRGDCLNGALAAHVDLPNLRAFQDDAVSFSRHFSVTNPCGPSRASLLTGQYAMNHRPVRNGAPLRHDTPNIATEMRRAGYLPMLFDHQGQGELANVADDPAYAANLARLGRQMLRHRMKNADHTLSLHSITPEGAKSRPRYS